MLPLLLLNSVHSLYHSEFQKITTMKKDAIYRLKSHEKMPWKRILYGVAKRFQRLTNPNKIVADTSAFIIDDTTDPRVGRHIENVWGLKTSCWAILMGKVLPHWISAFMQKRDDAESRAKNSTKKPACPDRPETPGERMHQG